MDEHWSLDKRVPVALIVAMISQLVGFGWVASKFDSRVVSLERLSIERGGTIAAIVSGQNQTNIALAEIKANQAYTVDTLREIKIKLSGEK